IIRDVEPRGAISQRKGIHRFALRKPVSHDKNPGSTARGYQPLSAGLRVGPTNLTPGSTLADDAPRNVTSAESDGDHLIAFCAPRRSDFDAFAGLLADQRARQRRRDGQSTLADIGFVLADDLKGLFLI